ncbi:MAG: acetyl-CoA C-acyltransferase [Geminicoccus sp.]|nr:acetyl-CoA C-acyltransferase [Geminicoccus sp.]
MVESVVIASAARTAIGSFGGSLKDVSAIDLGTVAAKAAIERSGMDPDAIGHTVIGNVIHGETRDMYISRVISVNAGVSTHVPALTVNRLCGSGLQAIVSAAQSVMLGDCEAVLAGGAESMSNGGYMLPRMRFGARMGESNVIDMMQGALYDPFGHGLMGITAENIASRYDISREMQDSFAVESQRRAAVAIEAGLFADQIVPVPVKDRRKTVDFDTDEHPRSVTAEGLAGMKTIFKADGSVTAGNASGINDGAAALTLVAESAADRRGATPLARIMAYGHAGVEPDEMGVGPVPAVKIALAKAGLKAADLDVIESNEAFAAQACYVSRELDLDPAKVNPNGGAIALGHPVGATGAILATKAIYELQRTGGRFGLLTMCIGGGQGIAIVIENLQG